MFVVRETIGTMETLTYNVQVPLLPTALQIKVVGLAAQQDELKTVVQQALANLDGTTNWK